MRYLLAPQYTFCGWDGLPYAVRDEDTKNVEFLNEHQFTFLWSCDGYTDIDAAAIEDEESNIYIDKLIQHGVISPVECPGRIKVQSYKKYSNRYRADVQLSLTGRCNYRCKHCFQSAPHGTLGQPTTQEILAELDQLVECGIYRISLTGGEPLIHPGFWDIVDGIIERGMILTTVYSNGALVNQELVDGFIARKIRPAWAISFDGLGCHDEMRGVPGAEKMALDAIKLLIANDFAVSCAYSLTKKSMKVFRESINLLASMGVTSLKSGCTQPQGEWLTHKDEWLTDEEYLEFYKTYIPQYLADGRPLNLQFEGLFAGQTDDEHPYYFMTDREVTDTAFGTTLSCASLAKSFYIGPTGRVVPCMAIDGTLAGEQFDTLRDKPLREILSKDSSLIRATSFKIEDVFAHNHEECYNCNERAHCGSGCRASAIGANGHDYLALDKRTCTICKEKWADQVKAAINELSDKGSQLDSFDN